MAIQSPQDLFFYDLCTMYDVELKLVQMLPQLAQESSNAQAREAFTTHEQETRQHVRNLEQCFQILGSQPMVLENHTITGLKEDHDVFLQQQPPQEAVTLFDLHAGYKSECIEIAAYYSLIDTANSLGLQQCAQLFQQNLQQEVEAGKKLTSIAHQLNQQPVQAAQAVAPNQQMAGQPYAQANQQAPGQDQPYETVNPQAPGQGQSYAQANPSMASQPSPVNQQPPGQDQPYAQANQQTASPSQMQEGMEVIGSDMKSVGRVRNVRDNDFHVDIPMHRDIYVPFTAIQNVEGDRVVLTIPAGQVNDMNWPKPPLL
jgi:ferritin-like metal-binding protein YciE